MKKDEYLRRLRKGLSRLPKEELEAAVSYYEEIFLDAGEENEEQTAEELGSVDDVIRQIYVENGIDPDGRPEQPLGQSYNANEAYNTYTESAQQSGGGYSTYTGNATKTSPGSADSAKAGKSPTIAKLLVLLITAPIWIPLLGVLFGVIAAVVGILFAVGTVLAVLLLCLGIIGFVMFLVGIRLIFAVPWLGLLAMGGGLVLVGLFCLVIIPICKALFTSLLGFGKMLFGRIKDRFYSIKNKKGAV